MPHDTRELILVRLRAIIETLAPNKAHRNDDGVTGRTGPHIILFDGGESKSDDISLPKNARGDPRILKDYMMLTPSITVILGSPTEQVGADLSGFRVLLIPTIINDSQLIALVGSSGELRYLGCVVETQIGEQREGRITLNFGIMYPFNVSDLM